MHEDIFSITPMLPIESGTVGEKHFVISFLAMLQTYVENW